MRVRVRKKYFFEFGKMIKFEFAALVLGSTTATHVVWGSLFPKVFIVISTVFNEWV